MQYVLYLVGSFLLLLSYFELAKRYNLTDRPNHRSSHNHETILGGGIIFPLLLLIHTSINGIQYPLFCSGLLLISGISFYDDIRPLTNKIRIFCHLVAVSLMFSETHLLGEPVWIVLVGYIIVIGTINAFNFMDGINGLTAAYSLVLIMTLLYINELIIQFIEIEWLILSAITILIFGFFNFRIKARCFAGDVGSISMAFILIFFMLSLLLKTSELKYLALLLVYGLDSVTTIIFRIFRRENIFKAHRSHFYQHLANIKSWPHLTISSMYAILQVTVNAMIIYYSFNTLSFVVLILISGMGALLVRFWIEGWEYLLKRQ